MNDRIVVESSSVEGTDALAEFVREHEDLSIGSLKGGSGE